MNIGRSIELRMNVAVNAPLGRQSLPPAIRGELSYLSLAYYTIFADDAQLARLAMIAASRCWAGVDSAWEQDSVVAWKILVNAVESRLSTARLIGCCL
jgi:hypothetical protein